MIYLRIVPQLAFCVFLLIYFLDALLKGSEMAIPWMIWPITWVTGGLLALCKSSVGERMILWCSFMLFGLGGLFLTLRIGFIAINGGMEAADGRGSPMAFLLGFAFQIVFFLLPGAAFFTWNLFSLQNPKWRNEAMDPTREPGE